MSDARMLPNLFVPGAQKSGTSTLHEYLARHPDIVMSATKEPHYFIRSDKGVENYAVFFAAAGQARYRGESSTAYMVSHAAVHRIAELVPDPRFVFLFRNPVDRAWSHYWWATGTYGSQPLRFREAFLEDARKSVPDAPWPWDLGYFHNGRYETWLTMYRDAFGAERVHSALFEDLVASPLEAVNGVCDFLGVDRFDRLDPVQVNRTVIMRLPRLRRMYTQTGRVTGRLIRPVLPTRAQAALMRAYNAGHDQLGRALASDDAPKLDPETREWVAGYYRESVEALRKATDLRLDAWGSDFPSPGA
jgi:hypothetical protein